MLQRAKKRDLNRRRSLEAHDAMMRKDEAVTEVGDVKPTEPLPSSAPQTPAAETKENDATSQ